MAATCASDAVNTLGNAVGDSSVATEWIQGKTLDEAVQVKNSDIASHLKLPPVKLHCR